MQPPATTSTRCRFITCIICASGALSCALLAMVFTHGRLNSDFLAFWSFPRFAATHKAGLIYAAPALRAFQQLLYPGFHSFYPYLYPPSFLLPVWWLKYFGFGAAQIIWSVVGLGVICAGGWVFFGRHGWRVLAAMLASPAALLNISTGETAFFTTGLLLAGLAWLPRRPILAGVAFGLLTLKPQLVVLVPVLLLARRDWSALASAALTACGLVALSCVVLPPTMWLAWAHALPSYQAQYFAGCGLNLNILITPAANLIALGAPALLAWAVQLLCTLAVAWVTCRVARVAPYPVACATLLCGSFLAVPHAYAYDSIPLTAAMALCVNARTPPWQMALGAVVYLSPLLLLTPARQGFLYAVPEALLFASVALQRAETCG